MSQSTNGTTHRRRFLFGGAAVGAGALLTACTGSGSSEENNASELVGNQNQQGSNAKPGKTVTIGLSIPSDDHGWMGAIGANALAQAESFDDVKLEATEGTNDVNKQISQIQTLINKKVDVLAILPFNGESLTAVAQQAMQASIPVVNIDRIFGSKLAYRTWVGGDNYGMGVNAGNFIANRLAEQGKTDNPVIVEVAGIDNLPLTQERSKGFSEALDAHGLTVTMRQAAEFTPQSGRTVMGNVLQAQDRIDAVWNHDDNQGVGVLAAIEQANRSGEFFMVGGAGSKVMMEHIRSGDGPMAATVLYPPTMSASAVNLARLIAQGRSMTDLVGRAVPSEITLHSATVTKDNVDQYLDIAF
ncbi:monosaccharide ABC transporter substrate-binding protein (CUT2 family) [Halopolyspora algeriensis]|uniref:Monosaccharide ABC transporter substrate-binding protein (CUT2 family) n=1 Tax=Halopolyspora algeriensis TaxID=1500506 RepID=A0A368VUK2_9ACTN|nr:substrate-binding domain-containing protein [Halopolyspora algeriensis]RCW45786.1 monosaccharide ABC transporter substrate-binding protein (CUT2 family) [Halopolyspora algeriensis]TQM54170.1 monosaccharide ABC transporter substrate-binding protein (CUT2 family) [Halopolyspora algeriensis]